MKKKKEVNYKKNLREYGSFLKNKKLIVFGIILIAILSQFLYVFEKYLFKVIVDNLESYITGSILLDGLIFVLLIIGGLFAFSYIVHSLNALFQFIFMGKLLTRVNQEIKQKYFSHIVKLDHDFHTSNKTGSLISRLGRATGAAEGLTETLTWELSPLIIQLLILIPAFLQFGLSQALTLLGLCVTFLSYSYYMSVTGSERFRIKENAAYDKEKAVFSDVFTNIDSVKYFGKENLIIKRFNKLTEDTKKIGYLHWRWWGKFLSNRDLIMGFWIILMMVFSLRQFIDGTLTLGELTFIYTTFIGIIHPLHRFSHGIRRFTTTLTDMQDLFEYGDSTNKIKDKKNALKIKIQNGDIEFKKVDFEYDKNNNIFRNFNLKIPRNKTVAFVGHSGCGKTTLVKLLYRLYDVSSGEITVDGINLKDLDQEALRSEMSIVPQEAILFDDTIYNNVKFAKPDATKEEVMKAMKFAQLDKFVQGLPKKMKTIVGERGVKLSGGQKQRVSIARAILADKKILVLDEATSALDSRTESEIQNDLKRLMKGRTSIVIAHRLSTIMNADLIVVMDKGKIVQMGSHRELITEGGEYQNLWDLQKGGFIANDDESLGEDKTDSEDK